MNLTLNSYSHPDLILSGVFPQLQSTSAREDSLSIGGTAPHDQSPRPHKLPKTSEDLAVNDAAREGRPKESCGAALLQPAPSLEPGPPEDPDPAGGTAGNMAPQGIPRRGKYTYTCTVYRGITIINLISLVCDIADE